MPHAMSEAFTAEETTVDPACAGARPSGVPATRQHECETHNERAMRAATAARLAASSEKGRGKPPRQQG